MKGRRQFLKYFFGFMLSLITLKYSKFIYAMNSLPYHHLPDGTFRNLPGSPKREYSRNSGNFIKLLYKGLIKREMFNQKEIPDDIPKNHKLDNKIALKNFRENKGQISITWLGHASFLIKLGNEFILTDPFLTKTAGPMRGLGPNRYINPGIDIENLPKIDTILISHNHYDHLDSSTLKKINNKENIKIICPLNLSETIIKLGYKNVFELDWHKEKNFINYKIISVPAYHWSRRLGQKYNSTLWSGYMIQFNNKKIYFSGDTAYGTMFTKIGKLYGPFNLSIVPIGAYEPRSMMKASHCTPEEAVEITSMLGSKNILGMHWGTIRLSAENPWEPPIKFYEAAKLKGYEDNQIWQLAIGQTKTLI